MAGLFWNHSKFSGKNIVLILLEEHACMLLNHTIPFSHKMYRGIYYSTKTDTATPDAMLSVADKRILLPFSLLTVRYAEAEQTASRSHSGTRM